MSGPDGDLGVVDADIATAGRERGTRACGVIEEAATEEKAGAVIQNRERVSTPIAEPKQHGAITPQDGPATGEEG